MQVTTIIVTYNATRKNWIRKCLTSVKMSDLKTDIIVVDNNSTDDTCEIIRDEFPDIVLIESKINLGFAKANNLAIINAYKNSSDYFFLLNQDAWVNQDTIGKLVNASIKNKEFGVLSPIHLNGDGDLLDILFLDYISDRFDGSRKLYTDLLKRTILKEIYEIRFTNAAGWLITRDCIAKVGVFDDILFQHYGEDDNYLNRVIYHNFKNGVVPSSFMYHDREERKGEKEKNIFTKDHNELRYISKLANILLEDVEAENKKELRKLVENINYYKRRLCFSKVNELKRVYNEKMKLYYKILDQRESYRVEPVFQNK